MRNLFITCILIATTALAVNAEDNESYAFEKGDNLIGVNIGVKLGDENQTAFSAFYEYGLSKLFVDRCTLGGGFFGGYYKDNLKDEIEKIYIAGVKLNVHYQFVKRLDTYAGIAPNFNIRTYELQKDEAKFECYFHIGGRYYLTNWLGVFAEMSTGYNNFSGGVSVKF